MQTVEMRNIISWNFVESDTINLPLRLRNERCKIRYSLNIPGRIFNRMVLKEYQKKQCNTTIRTLMFGKNNTLA
ncbi:MAG: hypothetical protein HXN70_04785 [Prevotella pallens]|uniref:hypothetical protein n=1 Tax=Prevotella pallens TaxID=60133 RepID=UPI000E0F2594|nr:hypothetical protein [Prevotella pallens]MBF1474781.1 hypothetical protein [Prevotella pallens]